VQRLRNSPIVWRDAIFLSSGLRSFKLSPMLSDEASRSSENSTGFILIRFPEHSTFNATFIGSPAAILK